MTPRFYERRDERRLQCGLCPHRCLIAPGKHGLCRVRFNRDGALDLPFYGQLSAVAVDPIEKKPLYHFYPGSRILSVGFVGCSLHCPFCQNHHIAHDTGAPTQYLSPQALVDTALSRGSFGISYTYSEPIVHLEYVLDTAALARRQGLKNVLVSNGYICPEPAAELIALMDAANIDLKTGNPEFYRRELGGGLEEVREFITTAAGRLALEVTTLVIPTKNDSEEEIDDLARFLASLDPATPYHLSAYYPQYKYDLPPTPPRLLERLAAVARRHLRYVYLGNVGLEESNTECPQCGSILVRRRGYAVSVKGLHDGRCSACSAAIPIVGV